MINIINHRRLNLSYELIILGFVITVALSSVYSQFSVHFYEIFNLTKSQIGSLVLLFTLSTIFFSFVLGNILEKFGEKKIFFISLILLIFTFIGFKFNTNLTLVMILGSLFYILVYIKDTSFNILFKDEDLDYKF